MVSKLTLKRNYELSRFSKIIVLLLPIKLRVLLVIILDQYSLRLLVVILALLIF